MFEARMFLYLTIFYTLLYFAVDFRTWLLVTGITASCSLYWCWGLAFSIWLTEDGELLKRGRLLIAEVLTLGRVTAVAMILIACSLGLALINHALNVPVPWVWGL